MLGRAGLCCSGCGKEGKGKGKDEGKSMEIGLSWFDLVVVVVVVVVLLQLPYSHHSRCYKCTRTHKI